MPTLRALAGAGHTIVGVVTQPDRPRGRGQKVTRGAVAAAADALGLPVLQPARLADPGVADALAAGHADLGVVAAYGKILPEWLLALPPGGMVNVHASLLPKYRGAAPVHRAMMAGERETGVTIMRVVKALDAGPMLARAVVPIGARRHERRTRTRRRRRGRHAAGAGGRTPGPRPGRGGGPGRQRRHLRRQDHPRRQRGRLAPARAGHSRSDPRPAPVAACLVGARRPARHPAPQRPPRPARRPARRDRCTRQARRASTWWPATAPSCGC